MTLTDTCISANLDQLDARLLDASGLTVLAREAMQSGKRSLAIGTVLPLEQLLAEATALLTTILLLHRSLPVTRRTEDAS